MEHGRAEESIEHLLRAGEHDQAFTEISHLGHRFFERGESATLVRWLSTIQGESSTAPARVVISLLAAQLAADLPDAAAETHRAAGAASGSHCRGNVPRPTPCTPPRCSGACRRRAWSPRPAVFWTSCRACATTTSSTSSGWAAPSRCASWPSTTPPSRTSCRAISTRPPQRLRRALHLPGAQYPIWRFYTVGSLALVRAWTGHCTEALQLADAALSGARAIDVTHHPAVIHAHLAAALAQLYRVDFDRAAEHLDMADLQNLRRPSNVVNLDLHRALAAQLCAAAGDSTEALGVLRGSAASAVEPPVLAHANRALHARLLIDAGELPEARALLDDPGRSVELERGAGRPGPGRR